MVLLAQDAAGLANLQRLSSLGFLETEPGLKPQLALDVIAAHAEGLILLTGGTVGPLARLLAEGQKTEAEALLARLAEAFPDRAVVELHRHGLPIERAIEPGLIMLGRRGGLAAGRDQRLLLRQAEHVRGARRAAVHRRGAAARRSASGGA